MIWMTLETILVSVGRARFGSHTFSRERDKLTDYLYQILLRELSSREARGENFLVKVKKFTTATMHITGEEKEISRVRITANRLKSAFLVLCCSNICRMSTKKQMFEGKKIMNLTKSELGQRKRDANAKENYLLNFN